MYLVMMDTALDNIVDRNATEGSLKDKKVTEKILKEASDLLSHGRVGIAHEADSVGQASCLPSPAGEEKSRVGSAHASTDGEKTPNLDRLKNSGIKSIDQMKQALHEAGEKALEQKKQEIGKEVFEALEKEILLDRLDRNWIEEQTSLNDLREGIWMRAYAQQDPKQEFEKEAHELYESMQSKISEEAVQELMKMSWDVEEKKE